jgi:hypothetical protein
MGYVLLIISTFLLIIAVWLLDVSCKPSWTLKFPREVVLKKFVVTQWAKKFTACISQRALPSYYTTNTRFEHQPCTLRIRYMFYLITLYLINFHDCEKGT